MSQSKAPHSTSALTAFNSVSGNTAGSANTNTLYNTKEPKKDKLFKGFFSMKQKKRKHKTLKPQINYIFSDILKSKHFETDCYGGKNQ